MNPPLLKLRTDIFKEGVDVVNGSAEEEKEEGEVDTSLSSLSSDEFPTDSAISSFVSKLRTEADQPPPPLPIREENRNFVKKRKFWGNVEAVQFLSKGIEEKRMKIAQLVEEINADQSKIEKITQRKISPTAAGLDPNAVEFIPGQLDRQPNLGPLQMQRTKNQHCELCSVTVYNDNAWHSHLNGKKHRKRELEEREIVVL